VHAKVDLYKTMFILKIVYRRADLQEKYQKFLSNFISFFVYVIYKLNMLRLILDRRKIHL